MKKQKIAFFVRVNPDKTIKKDCFCLPIGQIMQKRDLDLFCKQKLWFNSE